MSKRDVRLFLEDILEAIGKIKRYIAGLTLEEFARNEMIIDAVTRNLEIIGEASGNIPQEIRVRYSTIEWKRVVGFRNIAIHTYFAVDVGIIWTIASQRLDELKPVIRQMLDDIERQQSP
jgi:uncharacterized protein with HEPN domain